MSRPAHAAARPRASARALRARVAAFAVLALAALLAGCADDPATAATTTTGSAEAGAVTHEAPVHAVGDAFEWSSPQLGTYTYAITAEEGDDFLMGTDDADVAFFDARSDISTLGQVRKSDLAGSQMIDGGLQRVEFFRFPLAANKTWGTTWDGEPVTVHVVGIDAQSARLEARRPDGSVYATYTYEAKWGYFGHLGFHDGNGTLQFDSAVQRASKGYAGPIRSWHLEQVVDFGGPMTGSASTTFTVPAGLTDIYIEVAYACSAGTFVAAVGPPTGPVEDRGYSETDPCPQDVAEAYPIAPGPAQAENWGAFFAAAPNATGTYEMRVLLRTLVEA